MNVSLCKRKSLKVLNDSFQMLTYVPNCFYIQKVLCYALCFYLLLDYAHIQSIAVKFWCYLVMEYLEYFCVIVKLIDELKLNVFVHGVLDM